MAEFVMQGFVPENVGEIHVIEKIDDITFSSDTTEQAIVGGTGRPETGRFGSIKPNDDYYNFIVDLS